MGIIKTLPFPAMKVLLLLIALVYLASAQKDCTFADPPKCGPEEMPCWGGVDENGCMFPDFCMPIKGGTFDNNGLECPTACPPVYCGKDMKSCYGGDDGNGCMWPNVCSPIDLECPTM